MGAVELVEDIAVVVVTSAAGVVAAPGSAPTSATSGAVPSVLPSADTPAQAVMASATAAMSSSRVGVMTSPSE
jgi:hypothetical protein